MSDCHFGVSPVNYPDPDLFGLGRFAPGRFGLGRFAPNMLDQDVSSPLIIVLLYKIYISVESSVI